MKIQLFYYILLFTLLNFCVCVDYFQSLVLITDFKKGKYTNSIKLCTYVRLMDVYLLRSSF